MNKTEEHPRVIIIINNNNDNEDFERRDATEEEIRALPHVVDKIPMTAWIAQSIGAVERFTFYGITAPWQNYLQNRLDNDGVPGALGLGQSTATNVYYAFLCFTYLTPLPLAIISDTWLGRYKTLCISMVFYMCGCVTMFTTSLPGPLHHGSGVGGLASAMVLIGLGAGGAKATIPPFIADQYPDRVPQVFKTKQGTLAVADRALTLQYIYNTFNWFSNIAGLASIATTILEKNSGFWAAYLLPTCSLWIVIILLVIFGRHFIKLAPQDNILPMASKVLACASSNGFNLENARPLIQAQMFGRQVPWDDTFVSEVKQGLIACRVILSMVLFCLCYNQIFNNLVSQAGQMRLVGVPNDMIQALNFVACIILGPLIQRLYPFLAKRKIAFGPIARITTAYLTIGISMAYAAGIQNLIYSRGPCYSMPLACPASDNGRIPNDVNVFAQTPIYFILALAEILGFVSVSEYAYSKAPRNMRTVVPAFTQLTAGVSSIMGMVISPLAKDPYLVVFYAALAAATVAVTPVLWVHFRKYDRMDKRIMLEA